MHDRLFFVYLPVLKSSLNVFWTIYYIYRFVKYIYTVITGSSTTDNTTATINSEKTATTETILTTTTATLPYQLIDNISTDDTTTISNDRQIADYGPLHEGIIFLKDWIQQNGFNKLSALSSPLVGMQSYTMFAKDALLELVTTDRSSRLQALINFVSDKDTNEEESNHLAAALASIMMMCFENVLSSLRDREQDQKEESPFYDALPMLTNAIRACPDTFIYDFMLLNITNASTATAILKHDLDAEGNNMLTNNKKKLNSDIIDGFFKNDFMAPLLPNDDGSVFSNLSKCASDALKRKFGYGLLEKDAQLIMFEHYAERTLSTINQIKSDLWDTDLFGPNVAPPAIPSTTPLSSADSLPSYSTGTPPSLSTLAAALTDAPMPADIETIVSKDKYDYEQDAGEYEQFKSTAHLLAKFDDDVLTLRNKSTSIQPRIEALLANMDTFNNIHKLAIMGLTAPSIPKRIVQLQKAFRSLITSFQQHREYVFQYEKGFTFYQMYNFVDRFETDALNERDIFRDHIRKERVNVSLFAKLERKSDLFISMSYNLKTILQRFIEHDLDYSNDDYTAHAEEIHENATMFATTYGNEFCTRLFSERIFSETYYQHENSRIFRHFPQIRESDITPFSMPTSYYDTSELQIYQQKHFDELVLPQQSIGDSSTTQSLSIGELIRIQKQQQQEQQQLGEPISPSTISSFEYKYRAENFAIPPFARNFRQLEQQQSLNQQNNDEGQQQNNVEEQQQNNDECQQQSSDNDWEENNGYGWRQKYGDGWWQQQNVDDDQ